jgi:hypothetical protein
MSDKWKRAFNICKDILLFVGMPVLVILYVLGGRRIDELSERREVLESRITRDIERVHGNLKRIEGRVYAATAGTTTAKKHIKDLTRDVKLLQREIENLGDSINRSGKTVKRGIDAVSRFDAINVRFREVIQRLQKHNGETD